MWFVYIRFQWIYWGLPGCSCSSLLQVWRPIFCAPSVPYQQQGCARSVKTSQSVPENKDCLQSQVSLQYSAEVAKQRELLFLKASSWCGNLPVWLEILTQGLTENSICLTGWTHFVLSLDHVWPNTGTLGRFLLEQTFLLGWVRSGFSCSVGLVDQPFQPSQTRLKRLKKHRQLFTASQLKTVGKVFINRINSTSCC